MTSTYCHTSYDVAYLMWCFMRFTANDILGGGRALSDIFSFLQTGDPAEMAGTWEMYLDPSDYEEICNDDWFAAAVVRELGEMVADGVAGVTPLDASIYDDVVNFLNGYNVYYNGTNSRARKVYEWMGD